VTVPQLLPINEPVSTEDLVSRINAFEKVKTFAAQGLFDVRSYYTGVGGKADDFPAANGILRLQRPDNIRVKIRVPVINSSVADMVSDGQQFRLAMFQPKKRFLRGSNLKDYDRMAASDVRDYKDPDVAKAGGLVNMRPQHVTEAFLIKPVLAGQQSQVFREEVKQEEAGPSKRRVYKSYSVLYVVEPNANGVMELRRKFWFDRTQKNNPLARQQIFDNGTGKLASDIFYSNWGPVANSTLEWPGVVVIDRFNDGYKLELILDRDLMEPDVELPNTTFILENTEKFEEIDMDAPRKSSAGQTRKLPESPPPNR
jgi:hypothetical protein